MDKQNTDIAVIQAQLVTMNKTLDRLVDGVDRLIRVEENQKNTEERVDRMYKDLEAIKTTVTKRTWVDFVFPASISLITGLILWAVKGK